MKCWGSNNAGQTGGGIQNDDKTLTLRGTATKPLSVGETATAIAAGSSHTCAILADKSVKCWGDNRGGQTSRGTPLTQDEKATHISAGSSHTCAILTDKSVKCWGSNGSGQIGGGSQNNDNTLTLSGTTGSPLSQGEEATHIAAGGGEYSSSSSHTCAILADRSVKCWGSNWDGQTGGGSQNNDNTLTLSGAAGSPLSQGEEATHIAAGKNHTCAILADKSVKCWGSNNEGQTGRGIPLTQDEKATHIAAGGEEYSSSHTCAILSDKSVKCWGYNWSGQIGGGTQNAHYNDRTLSGTEGTPLSTGETAIDIAAGSRHTCAILADRSVKCWGSNFSGQTGDGDPLSDKKVKEALALIGILKLIVALLICICMSFKIAISAFCARSKCH